MKKNFLAILSLLTAGIVQGQNIVSIPTTGQNYILTRTFRDTVRIAQLAAQRTIGKENQTIQYFDGLGREVQRVQLMASPTYKDIVQHIEYDGFGRENTKYLPYAEQSGNGSFRSAAKTTQADFYKVGGGWDLTVMKTGNPYAVAVFESSPLNRVQQQGAPGTAWQPAADRNTVPSGANVGRTVATEYGTNGVNDVRLWTINGTNNGAAASYYTAGRLYKTVLKDENWINKNGTGLPPSKEGTVEEFKDFEDRVVLKRIWETESKSLNTYYVYDDFGDLRYVLPPGFTGTTFSETVSGDFFELIYAYKYDARKRVVRKKIPGKGWEYYVYNNNDQIVFTRDAEQLARGEWSFTKYDAQGRVILTGIEKGHTGDDQSSLQSALSSLTGPLWEQRGSAMEGYTNNTIPQNTGNITVQAVNYYDNYTSIPGLPFTDHSTYSIRTQSLLVANKVLVLDSSPAKWLWTVNDYDDQGRIVKVSSTNHLDGTDIVTNEYNFSDQLVKSTSVHTPSTGTAVNLSTGNDYDHQGRLVQIRKKVNSQTEIIQSKLAYNEIGQLTTKSLHSENGGSNFMTSIAYAYNERCWQTKAISAQFTSLLNYNVNGTTVLANAQYNGNIAQQLWGYAATTNSTFNYSYDALNRLKNGVSTGTVMTEAMTYDDMGNIRTLVRDNGTMITYGYNNSNKSNRLNTLSGGLTGSFTYDQNGNATKDRTGMLLTYNQLNLPKTVIGGGKNIAYTYDALGTKLSRLSDVGGIKTQRDYIGGIEYSKTGTGSSVIERIGTEDGFLLNSSGAYSYYYNLTDHLGNVRVVLKKGGTSTVPTAAVMQKQDYYPFGKTKSIATSIDNKYLYNGKEMQADLNGGTHTLGSSYILEGQLDYGARFYDAEIGRWNVIDDFSDDPDQSDKSPYAYTWNNPANLNDPDGNFPTFVTGAIGAAVGGVLGGGIEAGRQIWNSGKVTNWKSVGGSALQGAITGGVAGLTGGASLLSTAAISGGANVVGGAANRMVQGKSTTVSDIAVDAVAGAALGVAGKAIGNAVKNSTNSLSNQAKGKLGESVTKIKYNVRGYIRQGTDDVLTGDKTPKTNVNAKAKFDHKFKNIFTKKQITVESKFNKSGLTNNQRTVIDNGYKVKIDRTTSVGLGEAARGAIVGSAGGASAQTNR